METTSKAGFQHDQEGNAQDSIKNSGVSGTPYDDAFRTMLVKCPHLLIPVVNEAFGTKYSEKAKVIFLRNDLFISEKGKPPRKRVTDSSFFITEKQTSPGHLPHYLMECQTNGEKDFLIRLFEYVVETGLDDRTLTDNKLIVRIPRLCVLFLRDDSRTPERMEILIETSESNRLSMEIPVIKTVHYSLDDFFRKKLFFLLPFYMFTMESHLA